MFIYEGFIKAVRNELLMIEMEGNLNFFLGFYLKNQSTHYLPEINDKIRISTEVEQGQDSKNPIILNENDNITYIEVKDKWTNKLHSNRLLKMIQNNEIKIDNLSTLFDTLYKLQTHPKIEYMEKIVIAIHAAIDNQQYTLKLVSNYKCEAQNFQYNEYWTFGTYHRSTQFEYLFGSIFISNFYGVTCITDHKHNVRCIILNTTGLNIEDYLNRYVLIKDYTMIMEAYNDTKIEILECFVVDLKNIILLDCGRKENENQLIYNTFPSTNIHDFYCLEFSVLNKLSIIVNNHKRTECWLEIYLNESHLNCYLCLDSDLMKSIPLIVRGNTYRLYHKQKLQSKYDANLRKMKAIKQFQVVGHAFLVHFGQIDRDETGLAYDMLMDVGQAKKAMHSGDLISFYGRVKRKRFTEPLPSEFHRDVNISYFGTPGKKTHLLEIESNGLLVEVYLNNWHNLLMPFGIIPGAFILIRNVQSQKGKYLKSTRMTTLEILGYDSSINVQSALMGYDWGVPFYPSLSIPMDTVIWFKSLWINVDWCQIVLSETQLKCEIRVLVYDNFGRSRLYIQNSLAKEFLRLIFDLQPKMFEKFLEVFHKIRTYTFNAFEKKDVTDFDGLDRFFETFNARNLCQLEMKCRCYKITGEYPSYNLIGIRKN